MSQTSQTVRFKYVQLILYQFHRNKKNTKNIFIGRTDAKVPLLWSPDMKSRFIGKDLDAGEYGKQKEKGGAEDKMVREHHRLEGHESEQTLGGSEGQRRLACCSPRGGTESDMT